MSLQIATVKEIVEKRKRRYDTSETATQAYFIGLLIYMQAHTMIL